MDATFFNKSTHASLQSWADARGICSRHIERIFEGIQASQATSSTAAGQQPTIHFPGLRAQPFWPRSEFSWVHAVEAAAPDIRADYERGRPLMAETRPSESAHTDGGTWSVMYIVCVGRYDLRAEQRFPHSVAALRAAPGALSCGMTYFSTITPQTHILPHSGFTNAHLRCHLALSTAEGCRIRLGQEMRTWVEGQVLIFDDTYEHEVWNESLSERVLLLFDVFHPDLSKVECDALDYLSGLWRRSALLKGLGGSEFAV